MTQATSTAEVSSPETADRVLSFLDGSPKASCRAIGEALGIGRETAHRAVTRLLAEGRLTIVRKGTGRDYPTTYRVESARHVCPECEQGKHANCDDTAWDDAKDEPTSCTCQHGATS